MKKIVFIFLLIISNHLYANSKDCDVSAKENYEVYPDKWITLSAKIIGEECNKGKFMLTIRREGKIVYEYQEKYTQLTALSWESITKADALDFVGRAIDSSNIIECNELEPIPHPYFYVKELIPIGEYQKLRNSACKVYLHNTHYEAGMSIVIPRKAGALPVNEYGL